jgi:hypothetical protein
MRVELPSAVFDNFHNVEWDPPAALTSVKRWTCRNCGLAVLQAADGHFYGSALTEECKR